MHYKDICPGDICVPRHEIARYLGYKRADLPDEQISALIEECMAELNRLVNPQYVYEEFPLKIDPDTGELSFAGMNVRSRSLGRNLADCSGVVLFAATLGVAPDMLIRRASVTQMAKATVFQAASAAMIEVVCDEVNRKIIGEMAERGLYCRPRFSPGYGDFSLDYQTGFIRILKAPKRIGLTLTDTLLMAPSKSVTAAIGVSPIPKACRLAGCEVCNMQETCDHSRKVT